jgi:hypothetical protein
MSNIPSSITKILDGDENGPGTSCYIGNHLVYVFPDESSNLNFATLDLTAFIESHSTSDLGRWVITPLKTMLSKETSSTFQTGRVPACVPFGTFIYVFWVDNGNNLRAMRCAADGSTPLMITLSLKTKKTNPVVLNGTSTGTATNVSASITPDGQTIAVQFVIPSPLSSGTIAHGQTIAVTAIFDPSTFEPVDHWSGVYTVMALDSNGSLWGSEGLQRCSLAWFSQGAIDGDATNEAHYQVVTLYNESGCTMRGGIWQVDAGLAAVTPVTLPLPISNFSGHFGNQPFITRDPSGAVRMLYRDNNGAVSTCYLMPNTAPTGTTQGIGILSPAWTGLESFKTTSGATYVSNHGPNGTFIGLPMRTGNSPCAIPAPTDPASSKVYHNCWLQDQMLAFFFASNNEVACATRFFGTSVGIPGYTSATPAPDKQNMLLLSMVADTFPYPPPSPDLWDNSSPSGMVDWTACTYEYLVGNETSADVAISTRAAIGVKVGADSSKGIGIKAESSLSSGVSDLMDTTNSVVSISAMDVSTKGVPGDNTATFQIAPQGVLFGHNYPTLTQDLFVFVDEANTLQINPAMLVGARLRTTGANALSLGGQYDAYCYTPGNLADYETASINTRMYNNFKAPGVVASDFVIDGKNYASYYTGGDYLTKIIKEFGVNCFGPAGNLPYLEFSFSQEGMQKTQYQETSGFTDAGTYFVDLEIYVGATVGEGIEVFGFGESQSFYGMAGGELNFSLTSTTGTTASWGVELSGYLNPLASGESYTVQMYILRPSRLWAAETKNFGGVDPTQVDVGASAPTRILFTVPYISSTLATRLGGPSTASQPHS